MGEIIEPAAAAHPNEAAPGACPERLAERVLAFAPTGFAVLDGGHYDDLPGRLRQVGLFGRSLFLDHADFEVERAGPWLVALAQDEKAADRVFEIVGGRPAAVFWCCESGEAVLYRHLRTLNMARIPAWAAKGESVPLEIDSSNEYETVMFRHWDPTVLGALLPVLDASQFARMIGPAQAITLWAGDFGGLKHVPRDTRWPPAPTGMLTIRSEQIEMLSERRNDAMCRRTADYLREVAADVLGHETDVELRKRVRESFQVGASLGLTSEQAYCRWAYMMLMSGNRIGRTPEARAYVTEGPELPDRRVQMMMDAIVATLRARHQGFVS